MSYDESQGALAALLIS